MTYSRQTSSGPRRRGGFTLVESMIAMVFVGVVLAGAMQAASTSVAAQSRAADRVAGRFLAQGLMSEMLAKPYENPDTGSTGVNLNVLGILTVKIGATSVNDFNGWTESPPQDADGNVIPGFAGWSREVAVQWVNPSSPMQVMTAESGAKRITVTAKKNGVVMYTLTALKVKPQ